MGAPVTGYARGRTHGRANSSSLYTLFLSSSCQTSSNFWLLSLEIAPIQHCCKLFSDSSICSSQHPLQSGLGCSRSGAHHRNTGHEVGTEKHHAFMHYYAHSYLGAIYCLCRDLHVHLDSFNKKHASRTGLATQCYTWRLHSGLHLALRCECVFMASHPGSYWRWMNELKNEYTIEDSIHK